MSIWSIEEHQDTDRNPNNCCKCHLTTLPSLHENLKTPNKYKIMQMKFNKSYLNLNEVRLDTSYSL